MSCLYQRYPSGKFDFSNRRPNDHARPSARRLKMTRMHGNFLCSGPLQKAASQQSRSRARDGRVRPSDTRSRTASEVEWISTSIDAAPKKKAPHRCEALAYLENIWRRSWTRIIQFNHYRNGFYFDNVLFYPLFYPQLRFNLARR
jgi:hypothetical protein